MWHKAIWKGHPMRLELTRVGLLVELANHYTTIGAWKEMYFDQDKKVNCNPTVICGLTEHCFLPNDLPNSEVDALKYSWSCISKVLLSLQLNPLVNKVLSTVKVRKQTEATTRYQRIPSWMGCVKKSTFSNRSFFFSKPHLHSERFNYYILIQKTLKVNLNYLIANQKICEQCDLGVGCDDAFEVDHQFWLP